jgi:uncharacterized protein
MPRLRLPIPAALVVLLLLALAYGGACAYLWWKQRELVFFPTRDVERSPATLGLRSDDVRVRVGGDASSLHGWWVAADAADAPAILYLHGNDLNIGSEADLDRIARLHRLGFSVLAVDYRGYGRSDGPFPSEEQVYEDAEAAWTYVIQERRIDPKQAFIYGHSLGGAVAIDLALRHPEAAGLIVESAFTSIADLARAMYRMFPTDLLVNQRFDALAKVPKLRVPVLFIHGTADSEVPHAMSERLFDVAPAPKWLTLVPGGGHEDSGRVDEERYARAVQDLLDTVRARRPRAANP